MSTQPNLPQTLEELCDWITKYADQIYVRDQMDGKWGSFTLAELPAPKALYHAMRFIKEGRTPHIVVRPLL